MITATIRVWYLEREVNDSDLLRYSRQIMLPEIEIAGQEKILASHVAIVGLGGLGSPVALYLAAAGVGHLTLIDDDVVDATNLQRQIAHSESSLSQRKVDSAAQTISKINSTTNVTRCHERLSSEGLCGVARTVDVLVDGTDNFATRYQVNEASLATGTPLVSGAAIRMEGQVAVFDPREESSPCYRCLYQDGSSESLNCAENGVVAPLVGIVGSVQAMETLKLLCEFQESSVGWVHYVDAKRMEWRKLRLQKNSSCPSCNVHHKSM